MVLAQLAHNLFYGLKFVVSITKNNWNLIWKVKTGGFGGGGGVGDLEELAELLPGGV